MKTDLRNLLDKIYELEGLVYLAIKRDEAAPEFLRLISKKGKEVSELTINIEDKTLADEEDATDPSHDTETPVSETPMDNFSEEYSIEDIEEEIPLPFFEPAEYEISDDSDLPPLKDTSLPEPDADDKRERGKLVFSVNERYRYRKELFNNSDVDFNNTLALVASMENYDEAEDYFLNEEGFDITNPVVTEFLDVINRYFK